MNPPENQTFPGYTEVKTLLAWTAPGRPFQKKSKIFYSTSLLIMLFVEIILFLFGQYMLMLVVLSFVFVVFMLATVPPRDFHYRISTEGIFIEDHFYLWSELYDFYFKKRQGQTILHVSTHAFLPGELTLTLGEVDQNHVKAVILPYLPYREYISPSFMDKAGDWLSKTFPLEQFNELK
ncbi:MAG TPA: hypothetical protein VF820_02115 [Patescibacteria group bacterium]